MGDAKKLVIFEVNEIPFRVFDHFIQRHPRSTLAALFQQSDIFETYANDLGHLSPWVTWPSLHRGVNDTEHGIFDYGQDLKAVDKDFPPIWAMLARAGAKAFSVQELGLRNVEIQDKSATFAYHIPQGVLVSYDPQKQRGLSSERRSISTTEIAPAILNNFGITPPSYMRQGFSLS